MTSKLWKGKKSVDCVAVPITGGTSVYSRDTAEYCVACNSGVLRLCALGVPSMVEIFVLILWILAAVAAFFLIWMVAALVYLKRYFAKIQPGQRTIVIGRWFS